MEYVEIPVTNRGEIIFAKVSPEDAEWASKIHWFALKDRTGRFCGAQGHNPATKKKQLMHRLVLSGLPSNIFVDHRNGDVFDNRRENLRPATNGQNKANSGLRRDNPTGFKGVTRHGGSYRAILSWGGGNTHLGSFKTPEEAARAWDEAARELQGEWARFNFPRIGERGLDGSIRMGEAA